MARDKLSQQGSVIAGLYLTSVAFLITYFSQLAGTIMFNTSKEDEAKELAKIIDIMNTAKKNELEDTISTELTKLIGIDGTGKSVTYEKMSKFYNFNTLYSWMLIKNTETALGSKENAENYYKYNKETMKGTFWDVILGLSMIVYVLPFYSAQLLYKVFSPDKPIDLEDPTSDKDKEYTVDNFSSTFNKFMNAPFQPIKEFTDTQKVVDKKKIHFLGVLNNNEMPFMSKAAMCIPFAVQLIACLLFYAPVMLLYTSKPGLEQYAMTGLVCNLLFAGLITFCLIRNGSVDSAINTLKNCKLKTFCASYVVAMGVWFALHGSNKKGPVGDDGFSMGIAFGFILFTLGIQKLMSRGKEAPKAQK